MQVSTNGNTRGDKVNVTPANGNHAGNPQSPIGNEQDMVNQQRQINDDAINGNRNSLNNRATEPEVPTFQQVFKNKLKSNWKLGAIAVSLTTIACGVMGFIVGSAICPGSGSMVGLIAGLSAGGGLAASGGYLAVTGGLAYSDHKQAKEAYAANNQNEMKLPTDTTDSETGSSDDIIQKQTELSGRNQNLRSGHHKDGDQHRSVDPPPTQTSTPQNQKSDTTVQQPKPRTPPAADLTKWRTDRVPVWDRYKLSPEQQAVEELLDYADDTPAIRESIFAAMKDVRDAPGSRFSSAEYQQIRRVLALVAADQIQTMESFRKWPDLKLGRPSGTYIHTLVKRLARDIADAAKTQKEQASMAPETACKQLQDQAAASARKLVTMIINEAKKDEQDISTPARDFCQQFTDLACCALLFTQARLRKESGEPNGREMQSDLRNFAVQAFQAEALKRTKEHFRNVELKLPDVKEQIQDSIASMLEKETSPLRRAYLAAALISQQCSKDGALLSSIAFTREAFRETTDAILRDGQWNQSHPLPQVLTNCDDDSQLNRLAPPDRDQKHDDPNVLQYNPVREPILRLLTEVGKLVRSAPPTQGNTA